MHCTEHCTVHCTVHSTALHCTVHCTVLDLSKSTVSDREVFEVEVLEVLSVEAGDVTPAEV